MGSQIGNESNRNSNAYPSGHRKSNQNRKITKGKAAFIEAATAAWVGLIFVWRVFTYQDTLSTILLSAPITATILYGLYMHYWHRVQGNTKLSILPLVLFFTVNAFFLGMVLAYEVGKRMPNVERLHFSSGTAIFSILDRTHSTPFRAVGNGPNGPIATPIQLLLYTTIANVHPSNIHIVGYSIDVSNSGAGPWTTLCPVSMMGRTLLWATDPSNAFTIKTDNFLDFILLDRKMAVDEVVSGWSAWECPESCKFSLYRMTIRDASGTRTSSVVQPDKNGAKFEAALDAGLHIAAGRTDISAVPITFDPTCHQ